GCPSATGRRNSSRGRTQLSHDTVPADWPLRPTPLSTDLPNGEVDDSWIVGVHLACPIDDLINRGVRASEPQALEDPAHVDVCRDVDGDPVPYRDLEISDQGVRCHGGDLGAHTIELQEAAHDRGAGRAPTPDSGRITVVLGVNAPHRRVEIVRH